MAFVHDEYGHFEGLVTPGDLLTALAGKFLSSADFDTDPPLVERDDGSWWVSGSLSADALADTLCIKLPEDRDYATVAGFALSVLKHLPEVGERFTYRGWRFEIVDMDGRKIDKLLATRGQAASRRRRSLRPSLPNFSSKPRCRRGRAGRPARSPGRGRGGPRTGPCRSSRWAISFSLRPASWSKRVMPSSFRRATNLGPTPFSRVRSSAGAVGARARHRRPAPRRRRRWPRSTSSVTPAP